MGCSTPSTAIGFWGRRIRNREETGKSRKPAWGGSSDRVLSGTLNYDNKAF